MASFPKRYKEYLNFVDRFSGFLGQKGDHQKGEIQIVTEPDLFPECEKGATKLMVKSGIDPTSARKRTLIGVRDENKWGVILSEPLRLPDGTFTTFVRAIPWSMLDSRIAGVVIVPELADGRVIIINNFRHNVREWSLEFPRGGKEAGKSIVKTIQIELDEEAGVSILGNPIKIGSVFPDTGFLSSKVDIFKVKVEIKGLPNHESTEAIKNIMFVTKNDLKQMAKMGKITDSYTLCAINFGI